MNFFGFKKTTSTSTSAGPSSTSGGASNKKTISTSTSAGPSTTSAGPSSTSAGPSTTSGGASRKKTISTSTSAGPSTTSAGPSSTSAGPSTTSGGASRKKTISTSTSAGPSTTSAGPSSTSAGPSTTSGGASRKKTISTSTSAGPSSTSAGPSTTSAGPSITSGGASSPTSSRHSNWSTVVGPPSPTTADRLPNVIIPPSLPSTAAVILPSPTSTTAVDRPSTAEKGKGKVSLTSLFKKGPPSSSAQIAKDAKKSNIRLKINEGRFIGRTKTFTLLKLQEATNDFNPNRLLGVGGFGPVFRGYLGKKKKEVAVKVLDPSGGQGIDQFVAEVRILDIVTHPKIIGFIGYCAENDDRLLVYELAPLGSLKKHLFDIKPGKVSLYWPFRVRAITSVLEALDYLHNTMNPAIIHGNLNSSTILLDGDQDVKLSGFGFAKVLDGENRVRATVMGAEGYCAPEQLALNELSVKTDVYSFGIFILEIMTGRKAFDPTKPPSEQMIVDWAKPLLRENKFPQLIDPSHDKIYGITDARKALQLAELCIHEQPQNRPHIRDLKERWLTYLAHWRGFA